MAHFEKNDVYATAFHAVSGAGLQAQVDWNGHHFCNIPFDDLSKVDFRNKRGRTIKEHCPGISAKRLRIITKHLSQLSSSSAKTTPHTAKEGFETSLPRPSTKMCSLILGWWTRYRIAQQGRHVHIPQRVNNAHDPISLEEIASIPRTFYFTFEHDELVYGMDIRNLNHLICHDMPNPFTKTMFPATVNHSVSHRIDHLTCLGYNVGIEKDPEPTTPAEKVRSKAVHVFQLLDELDNYTDVQWFYALTRSQLQMWYIRAEDIWNYRADLSATDRLRIVHESDTKPLFKYTSAAIKKIHHRLRLQNIVLNVMERWITGADVRSDRILGAMYVLSALTECSPTVANVLPWLYQPPS